MRRSYRLLSIATLVAAIAASCIVEYGPPSARVDFAGTLLLSADSPVVIRTIRYRAIPGEGEVQSTSAFLAVNGEEGGGPFTVGHTDVWVSILDPLTGVSSDSPNGNGHASVDGWGHGPDCRASPCDMSWMVIARWLDPEPGKEIPLELEATMTAWGDRGMAADEPFSLKDLSIIEAPEPRFEGAPALTRARVEGSHRVTSASAPEVRRLVLRIPGVLITGDRFPRLGRVFLGTTVTDWSGTPAHLRAILTFADRAANAMGGGAAEVDWLSLCPPREDCEIPMDLTITYLQAPEYWPPERGTPPPDGFMAIDWVVEARLEDFGSNAAMPAGIELLDLTAGG